MIMSLNKQENIFWSLAKKYSVIQVPSTANPANLNIVEIPFKVSVGYHLLKYYIVTHVARHVTESALTVMDDVCVLKEKTRKLEHEKCIHYHSTRNRSLKIMLDGSSGSIDKMNTELEFILHKKHVILCFLQNASKKKDSLPIPLHLHRTFINLLEGLLELCNIKMSVANFCKLSDVKWDQCLKGMQPLKWQTLRNISIFNKLLYDVCELQNSVNEMLLSTTPFVSSFFDDLEISSLSI